MNKGNSEKKLVVMFSILALVSFLLSSSVLPFTISREGFMRLPDLLLILCCIMPLFAGRVLCCIFALVCGFLQDLVISVPYNFSPVVYLVAVCVIPFFLGHFKTPGTLSGAVCALPCLALKTLVGVLVLTARYSDAGLGSVLMSVALPELVVNFACTIVMLFIIRRLVRWFGLGRI